MPASNAREEPGAPRLSTTRAAYDTVAVDYGESAPVELARKPLDRAMLAAFAELVQVSGGGPVADLGCGPGLITAHLHSLGTSVFGVDLSPRMVDVARRAYPDLRFDEGLLTSVPVEDETLGGIVAWYSIVHTPPHQLPEVFTEFHRALAPGGQLLLAFQSGGDERVHIERSYGHDVSLDTYRLSADSITELLDRTGIVVTARLTRTPPGENSTIPQAYLMGHKRNGASGS